MSDKGSGPIVAANPFRCRMWKLHDRHEEHVTERSCRQEILSFQRHGQLVPAWGRELSGDPNHNYELIFGARRLFVARHLNMPLRIELRKLSDREALVAMDIENRQRQDLSAYERGVAYARWLRESHFSSQDDIAGALGISTAQVSKLLKVAKLPAVVLNAFASPTDVRESWGLEIAAALEDPQRRQRTIRKAREIARQSARMPAHEVCRQLLAAPSARRKTAARARDEVILSKAGTPLFRVRHARTSVMLLLPSQQVSARCLEEIVRAVSHAFQQDHPEPPLSHPARRLEAAPPEAEPALD